MLIGVIVTKILWKAWFFKTIVNSIISYVKVEDLYYKTYCIYYFQYLYVFYTSFLVTLYTLEIIFYLTIIQKLFI